MWFTRIVIPADLKGTFFCPMRKTAYKSFIIIIYLFIIYFFENQKMQKVLCEG